MRGTVFSRTQTSTYPWKVTASYYDVTVDEQVNKDAAWYGRQPTRPPPRSPATWLRSAQR
jgi:uncharacterized protein (DUF427 family)